MKNFLFLLFLSAFSIVSAEVFVMPMDEPDKPAATVKASSAPSSSDLTASQDDEMLAQRSVSELMRYTICGIMVTDISQKNIKPQDLLDFEQQTGQVLPDKYTIVDHKRRYICGVYYAPAGAAGKGLAVEAAVRDLGNVDAMAIRSAVPVRTDRNDFNIEGKKPYLISSFNKPGIYKKVLTSKNKIRNLYNYADLPLAWQIDKLMSNRAGNDLPERISIYEDSSAAGAKGMAVIVFSGDEKHLIALTDISEVSSDIYGLKPDISYIYK